MAHSTMANCTVTDRGSRHRPDHPVLSEHIQTLQTSLRPQYVFGCCHSPVDRWNMQLCIIISIIDPIYFCEGAPVMASLEA